MNCPTVSPKGPAVIPHLSEGPQRALKEHSYRIPNNFQDKQLVQFHARTTLYTFSNVLHPVRHRKIAFCSSSIVSAITQRGRFERTLDIRARPEFTKNARDSW